MLSAIIWFLVGVIVTFGALIVHGLRLLRRAGRSAADPDKETPLNGWNVNGTTTSGKTVAKPKPSPACFVVEPLAPMQPRIGGYICVHCLHPIPDGETVWMHAPTGEVWHVRCRERYAKDRRTTLWEG